MYMQIFNGSRNILLCTLSMVTLVCVSLQVDIIVANQVFLSCIYIDIITGVGMGMECL